MTDSPGILVIAGPTASGKSELALRLAAELDAEIINADSMQVYRGMDIGTAKLSPAQQCGIPHHLIDIVSPDQHFSAADFAAAADAAIADISSRGRRVIVTGGTGLYIRSLLKGLVDPPGDSSGIRRELQAEAAVRGGQAMLEELRRIDPDLAGRIHVNNQVRIIRALEVYRLTGVPLSRYQEEHGFSRQRYPSLQICLQVERPVLYERIDARVDRMLEQGLLDEVRRLLAAGYGRGHKALKAIGYREMIGYLSDECCFDEAVSRIKRNTRHYAKRQMTWFSGEKDILKLEYPEKFVTILQYAIEFFAQRER